MGSDEGVRAVRLRRALFLHIVRRQLPRPDVFREGVHGRRLGDGVQPGAGPAAAVPPRARLREVQRPALRRGGGTLLRRRGRLQRRTGVHVLREGVPGGERPGAAGCRFRARAQAHEVERDGHAVI